jgi:uncharacterized membrane protein YbhN (UPF0104 family)
MRVLGLVGKLTVSALLLAAIFFRMDWDHIAALTAGLRPAAFAGAVLLVALQNLLLSARWALVMRALGLPLGPRRAAAIYHTGFLFNQALPTAFGGDAVRVIMLRDDGLSLPSATAAVILDRITGVGALLLLCAAGLPFIWLLYSPPPGIFLPALALVGAGAAGFVLFHVLDLAGNLVPGLRDIAPLRKILGVSALARRISAPGARAAGIWILAILAHLVSPVIVYVLLRGLGLETGRTALLLLVPVAFLALLIPVSYGGWGLREGAFILMLGLAGVNAEAAATVSVLIGLAMIVAGVAGGGFWLRDKIRRQSGAEAPKASEVRS